MNKYVAIRARERDRDGKTDLVIMHADCRLTEVQLFWFLCTFCFESASAVCFTLTRYLLRKGHVPLRG